MPKFGNSHGNVLEMKDLLLSFRCEIEVEKNSKITVTLKSYFLDHDLKSVKASYRLRLNVGS